MFSIKSVREVLKKVAANHSNNLDSYIANFLVINSEKGAHFKSKELSEKLNTSKAAITKFAQKYGFENYTDLYTRLIIESEMYGYIKQKDVLIHNQQNYEKLFFTNLEFIKNNKSKINDWALKLVNASKIFICPSYEINSKTISIIQNELNKKVQTFYFENRKIGREMFKMKDNKTVFLFLLSGLDTNEQLHYLNVAKEEGIESLVVSTKRQEQKVPCGDENIITLDFVTGLSGVKGILYRDIQINYLMIELIQCFNELDNLSK